MTLTYADRLNAQVADSVVGRWFRLEGSGHPREREGSRFVTEIRAGMTTWVTMAYIISVNASIISASGGTCVCSSSDCAADQTYLSCIQEVKRDLITSTAAISALASVLMGTFANLPVGMAPGMGLNAYFTYSMVGYYGNGLITYQEALSAVFLEGWLFFILSLVGVRQWLAQVMPQSLILAVRAGIGIYIAFIGLSPVGLNVIGGNVTHMVGLGGCESNDWLSPELPYFCGTEVLHSPTMWLGVFTGGILTAILMIFRVRGAILCGIIVTSIISWPRSTAVTYFPNTPVGDQLFDFFRQVVAWHPLKHTGNALDYTYSKGRVWYSLLTLLYVDILYTTGNLHCMAKFAGLRDPTTLDFDNSTIAYCVDAFSTSIGALLGTGPVTAFIESATGIAEGGKTGITAVVIGLLFFVSVFLAPIFASIPPWATGGTFIIVGSLMIRNIRGINWDYIGNTLPAFLTILIIPLSFNIAYGIIIGVASYVILNGFVWIVRKVTNDRISPSGYDASEPWSIPPISLIPSWIISLVRRRSNDATDLPSEYSFEICISQSEISMYSHDQTITTPKSLTFASSEK